MGSDATGRGSDRVQIRCSTVTTPPSNQRWPVSAVVVSIVLVLALVGAAIWGYDRQQSLTAAQERIGALEAQVTEQEAQIAALEAQVEELEAAVPAGLEELLGGLLGGEEGGSLEDLLGGLLGGEDSGSLEDLLGGLLGGGDTGSLEDLLGGMLGGEGGAPGLEGLLGGQGGVDPSCLVGGEATFEIDDSSAEAQLASMADAVEQIRQLEFVSDVTPTYVDAAEMEDRIAAIVAEDYPPDVADLDSRTLAALGAIPPGTDLVEAQSEMLGSGVAGFYDPETGELVVRTGSEGEALPALDQISLAHEQTHALTDQVLSFPAAVEDDDADPDQALAALSLVEGDATVAMQRYAAGALDPMALMGSLLDPAVLGAQQDLESLPPYLGDALQFPYNEGLGLTCALLADGDWEAVDAAYDRPPATTAEVMFPERYLADYEASRPPQSGTPGGNWDEQRRTTFGAADLYLLARSPGGERDAALADAKARAEGWDGGEIVLWTDGDESAVAVTMVDGGGGSAPLCDTVLALERAAFPDASESDTQGEREQAVRQGSGRSAVVACDGPNVWWGIAPDLATARRLTG